jgi:hypothetical protein
MHAERGDLPPSAREHARAAIAAMEESEKAKDQDINGSKTKPCCLVWCQITSLGAEKYHNRQVMLKLCLLMSFVMSFTSLQAENITTDR